MSTFADEYRRLLTSDESPRSVDAALCLIWRVLEAAKKRRGALSDLNWPPGPAAPSRAQRVQWALSCLCAEVRKREANFSVAEYSLLEDLFLLTFRHTYFAILPRLEEKPQTAQSLLRSFEQFGSALPEPSDRFHVLGLVKMARGEDERAENDFRSALAATHTDDHEFMSNLQLLWTLLLEKKDYKGAFRLLRDQYPRVTRRDLEEVGLLLDETLDAAQSSARRKTSQPGARKLAPSTLAARRARV
jgi:hypothetical protein